MTVFVSPPPDQSHSPRLIFLHRSSCISHQRFPSVCKKLSSLFSWQLRRSTIVTTISSGFLVGQQRFSLSVSSVADHRSFLLFWNFILKQHFISLVICRNRSFIDRAISISTSLSHHFHLSLSASSPYLPCCCCLVRACAELVRLNSLLRPAAVQVGFWFF